MNLDFNFKDRGRNKVALEMAAAIRKLNNATKAYDEGNPIISDKEWDDIYFWLVEAEKYCGFKTCFSADTKSGLTGENLIPTDTETYQSCREKFLKDIPHIALSRDILDFFQKCGGKLYISETGCAAVENIDGTAYYREALGGFCADTPNSVFSCPGRSIATGMIHESADFDFGWMGLTLE